jgi:hypothetical protein
MIKLKVDKRKLIALSERTRKTSTSVSKLILSYLSSMHEKYKEPKPRRMALKIMVGILTHSIERIITLDIVK